jgi:hypothetical protein
MPDMEPAYQAAIGRLPRLSDMPAFAWIALGLFLSFCVMEVVVHLAGSTDTQTPERTVSIPATAASVAPLTPAQEQELRYGPTPLHLPGNANFYVSPAGGPAVLYRLQPDHKTLVAEASLPPFSSLQALRLYTQAGMIEVLTGNTTTGNTTTGNATTGNATTGNTTTGNTTTTGFIPTGHLLPGGVAAARTAYCGYNAGTAPLDGEILDRSGNGPGTLQVENHAIEPAVIRLRGAAGTAVVSVFLSPAGQTEIPGLPAGEFHPEYAIGELWSRACNGFVTGMRAWRLEQTIRLPGPASVVVTNDTSPSAGTDIAQDTFESK